MRESLRELGKTVSPCFAESECNRLTEFSIQRKVVWIDCQNDANHRKHGQAGQHHCEPTSDVAHPEIRANTEALTEKETIKDKLASAIQGITTVCEEQLRDENDYLSNNRL